PCPSFPTRRSSDLSGLSSLRAERKMSLLRTRQARILRFQQPFFETTSSVRDVNLSREVRVTCRYGRSSNGWRIDFQYWPPRFLQSFSSRRTSFPSLNLQPCC